jgi:hypothetical protein
VSLLRRPFDSRVPERVVDLFEVVDVDEEDADDRVRPRGAFERVAEMLDEQPPVRQLRQRVVVRQMTDMQLRLLAFDRVPDGANEKLRRRLAFDEIVLRAAFHRLQREDFVFRAREDDERKIRRRADQAVQGLELLRVGESEIE